MLPNLSFCHERNKVTVTVIPDVKRTKTNQRTALNLRLTYKGRRQYYSTGFEASRAEWMTINSAEAKGKLRKIKNAIAEIEVDAQKCCDDIIPFSFPRFEYLFFSQKIIFQNLRTAYIAYMKQLKNNQQYSSAVSYTHNNGLDLQLVKSVGEYFQLDEPQMDLIISEVKAVVENWEKLAADIGIPRGEQQYMARAFTNV